MALIDVEHVTISYEGTIAVKDVSFSVRKGEYLVILGENGSGKSSIMRAMAGLVKPRSGKISYSEGLKRNQIGYLPQQTQFQKDFPASVEEVVLSGCINRMGFRIKFGQKERERANEALRMMDITRLRRMAYRNLSGGQQQRVLLARALCATDTILLLDEPVSGLDPMATRDMYQAIDDLNKRYGVTVCMVSHDVSDALKYATHVLVMNRELDFNGSVGDYRSAFGAPDINLAGAVNA